MGLLNFREWLIAEMGAATSLRNPAANKCVIMMGGPGSGKSHAGSFFPEFAKLQSDKFLQHLMVKASKEGKLKGAVEFDPSGKPNRYNVDFHNPLIRSLNDKAHDYAKRQQDVFAGALTPFIIELTGQNPEALAHHKNTIEKLGYDVFGVMIQITSMDMAVHANRTRDRKINEKDLLDIHKKLKNSSHIRQLRVIFNQHRFFDVVNDHGEGFRQQMTDVRQIGRAHV